MVLEKDKDTVQRIVNGVILSNPLLDVNVATLNDRGMLDIAIIQKRPENRTTKVYVGFDYSYLNVVSFYQGGDNCNPKAPPRIHPIYYNIPIQDATFRIVPAIEK